MRLRAVRSLFNENLSIYLNLRLVENCRTWTTFYFFSGGQIYKATTRRKSVFAETYDPEEDEQEEKPVSIQS